MISVRLEGNIPIKTCNQCKAEGVDYKTESVETMLSHLNQHRIDEIEANKQQTFNYERVKR